MILMKYLNMNTEGKKAEKIWMVPKSFIFLSIFKRFYSKAYDFVFHKYSQQQIWGYGDNQSIILYLLFIITNLCNNILIISEMEIQKMPVFFLTFRSCKFPKYVPKCQCGDAFWNGWNLAWVNLSLYYNNFNVSW